MGFLDRCFRLFRVVVNSFTFIIMLIIAYALWGVNPILSIVMLLASIDQLEDVYYYMYNKRLFPDWFLPFDLIFETIAFLIGLGLFLFSLLYYAYFASWFFEAMLFISVMVMWSAVEDAAMWIKSFREHIGKKPHEVREEEKLPEEEKIFVKHR